MNQYSSVIGFNYQPSYAFNSYEAWRFFDANVFDREIGLGKKYFPKMTLRITAIKINDLIKIALSHRNTSLEISLLLNFKYN